MLGCVGAADAALAGSELGVHRFILGRSVKGRPIVAYETGDTDSPSRELVVGCIHGDEPAGIAITHRVQQLQPAGVDLWLIPVLNPDGRAAATRGNAHGVDLNRNFPSRWRPLHGVYDSGPRPLSEPESRIAFKLIERLRPQISIWFHQHLDLVDESGGDLTIERRFAAAAGLPLKQLTREPGSAVTWQNRRFPDATAFVVELAARQPDPTSVDRYARAVLTVAGRERAER